MQSGSGCCEVSNGRFLWSALSASGPRKRQSLFMRPVLATMSDSRGREQMPQLPNELEDAEGLDKEHVEEDVT